MNALLNVNVFLQVALMHIQGHLNILAWPLNEIVSALTMPSQHTEFNFLWQMCCNLRFASANRAIQSSQKRALHGNSAKCIVKMREHSKH
jgi:hypothetical protein